MYTCKHTPIIASGLSATTAPWMSTTWIHWKQPHTHLLMSLGPLLRIIPLPPAGVASNGVFAGLMLALAAGAATNGVLQPPPLLPDWSELGNTPIMAAIGIATVVPVLLNCDVCHQSLHPLMPLLQVSCL